MQIAGYHRTLSLLFLIYVNNIAESIESSISLFADDTALLFSSRCPLLLHQVLTRCDVHTLSNWSKLWNVNFNPAKTKVLTISKPHISHPVLTFNNTDLSKTDSYKYLGLIIHRISSRHHHILSIKQKATLWLYCIKQLYTLFHARSFIHFMFLVFSQS